LQSLDLQRKEAARLLQALTLATNKKNALAEDKQAVAVALTQAQHRICFLSKCLEDNERKVERLQKQVQALQKEERAARQSMLAAGEATKADQVAIGSPEVPQRRLSYLVWPL